MPTLMGRTSRQQRPGSYIGFHPYLQPEYAATRYNGMTRAIVFRIIGFGFLVFAAISIYNGEFAVGRAGEMVITRAHDPQSFWRGIIMQIGAGCFALYLSRSAQRSIDDIARQAEAAKQRPRLPNFSPEFCGKVLKGAACVCVGLIIAELLVLLFVHPSEEQCPGWIFHPHQRSAASLWVLAGMLTVLPTLGISHVALRWDDFYARKAYDSIAYGPPQQLLMDMDSLTLMVAAFWCLFCAIPLFLMLGQCTGLSHYLNAFHL